ncbi:MAG TPA: TolC family protein [Gemmatimonadaceae bacterium]|nr:TolC family protein [Gemmatimonadaceae bacterium]
MTRLILMVVVSVLLAPLGIADAQARRDSLQLATLREAALNTDPRAAQPRILAAQSALRLNNIGAEQKPALSVEAFGQYQSDVASIPLTLPGVTLPTQPNDIYDARLIAQQRIYDPTTASRRSVERAQLAESQARVRTAIYGISESVNAAFFAALRAQTQTAELQTTLTDLEAQLAVADARVKGGTALAGERSALQAELLRRRQAVAEQAAIRRASIAILSDLVAYPIDQSIPLSTPDLSAKIAVFRDSSSLRMRPEYEQFERSRDVLRRIEDSRSAQDRPRVSAFGRVGYGRPGLKFLTDRFDSYWLAGVQVQWTPWSWGTSRRDRQITALQRDIVATEEETFTASLRRAAEQDLAAIDRLESTLARDDEIIALRESILAETRARYAEAVVTSAEYVDRQTDVLSARLTRAMHRVELAQARAHLLTILGIEVR